MACSYCWQVGADWWLRVVLVLLHVTCMSSQNTNCILQVSTPREGNRQKSCPLFWLSFGNPIPSLLPYSISQNKANPVSREGDIDGLSLREWQSSRRTQWKGCCGHLGNIQSATTLPVNLVFLTGNLYLTTEWLECPATLRLGKTALSYDMGWQGTVHSSATTMCEGW